MKARHIALLLVGAPLVVWALLSCDLGAVSIDQRISTFQSDLNSSSRTNVYLDFHPTLTSEYNSLKNPSFGINTEFPGASYTLSVVDESNPVSGVIVAVSGASGLYTGTWYLLLTMATYNNNDWRIVTLSDSQTTSGWALRFY